MFLLGIDGKGLLKIDPVYTLVYEVLICSVWSTPGELYESTLGGAVCRVCFSLNQYGDLHSSHVSPWFTLALVSLSFCSTMSFTRTRFMNRGACVLS